MAKRALQGSVEERVTAKSRPMMNLGARAPSHVSSSTSVSREKRRFGSQDPWSSIAEKEERWERPDIGIDRLKASDYYYHEQFMESFSSASYSKWDDDRAQQATQSGMMTVHGLLKSGKLILETYERPERPDETSWGATQETQTWFLSR